MTEQSNKFDAHAKDWDRNNMHHLRSVAIAESMQHLIPFNKSMAVLEYGAGTGLLSFLLHDQFKTITLMDNSVGMVDVCNDKIRSLQLNNVNAVVHDLEKEVYSQTFDIIYFQMVLHHIENTTKALKNMHAILNTNGWLSIADLYTEDGTFHGEGEKVHHGFNPDELKEILEITGFYNIKYQPCFEIKRDNGKTYPIFILVAQKCN